MKKNFKLVLALMVAVMMIASMIPAMAAATDVTLTLPDDDHTYDVYQIFTGDLADGKLSNLYWGENGTGTAGQALTPTELTNLETVVDGIAANATDNEKLAALANYVDLNGTAFQQSVSGTVTVPTGYYLIKDDSTALDEGDEHTLYILEVVDAVTMTRKASTTESHKTVDDVNDSDPGDADNNVEKTNTSDWDVGDEVPYHLTATISDKVGNYPKYHITFVDELEAGKFDAISELTIKMDGADIADNENYTVAITDVVAPTKTGFEKKIEFTPKAGKTLASLAGKTITIDFTATLGEGCVIGEDGNHNTFHVKFSNNPNNSDGKDEGETPEETVVTFTYKLDVDKVDENGAPLSGADFVLWKIGKTDAESSSYAATDNDALKKNAFWAAKTIIKSWHVDPANGNQFSFKGLDDGYYVLAEVVTPSGYNTIDPQVFKVEATHTSTNITALSGTVLANKGEITFSKNLSDGQLKTSVQNHSGIVLPSTGGIGTTIFYVAGSLMVLAAAILLVTKRRMGAED